jgi:GT2 family glycosyltransferase
MTAVAAVIPCFSRQRDLDALLADLAALHLPPGVRLDITVVDNASSPPITLPARPAAALLRLDTNTGGAGGFNAGLRAALAAPAHRPDFLWLLDSDVRVDKHALAVLLDALVRDTDAVAAGSELRDAASGYTYELGGRIDPRSGCLRPAHTGRPLPAQPIPCDYLAACSLLVRAGVARSTGLLPDVFVYHDDVDWTIALVQHARRTNPRARLIAVPGSIVAHPFRRFSTALRAFECRNAFAPLHRLALPRPALLRRALFSTSTAVSLALLGFPALARLYPPALADAAAGQTTGRGRFDPAHPRPGPTLRPLSELPAALADLARSRRTLTHDPALRELATAATPDALAHAYSNPDLAPVFHGGLRPGLHRSAAARLLRRLLRGPSIDVLLSPLGWDARWLSARTLVALTGDRFFITDVRVHRRLFSAALLALRCTLPALRIAMGPRRLNPLPPAPAAPPPAAEIR